MNEYSAKLDDETESYLTLLMYKNVDNTREVREQILSGELPCCMIKASLISDPFQIVVAANKAVLNKKYNRLTTKSINTEVLFCLSLSKNISQSLLEFGINDSEKNIIAAIIHKTDEQKSILEKIRGTVKGEEVSIDELSNFVDFDKVRKAYKIDNEELKVSSLLDSIVSKISIKDFASSK